MVTVGASSHLKGVTGGDCGASSHLKGVTGGDCGRVLTPEGGDWW